MKRSLTPLLALSLIACLTAPAAALDDAHWRKANESIEQGIAYLRTTQNDNGSWSPRVGPAVTALAVQVMLDRPQISADDPAVAKGIDYILS